MAALKTLRNLDKYEQMLISRFKSHPCFGNLYRFSREEFLTLLLQRRFLSLAFTPVYDMAIDGLTDPQAKQTARHLLREEYPDERGVVLSHREDLVTDLLSLGATRKMLFESHPTDVTLQSIQSTFALFGGYTDDDFYQIRLLTILRFWGEVLVSAEYGMLWDRLEEMGLAPTGGKQSIFYYLHYRHDAKQKSLDDPALVVAIAHADRLAVHLTELLTSHLRLSIVPRLKKKFWWLNPSSTINLSTLDRKPGHPLQSTPIETPLKLGQWDRFLIERRMSEV